jgi:hypothetical protein
MPRIRKVARLMLAWCRAYGVSASLAATGCPTFDGAIVEGWCVSVYARVRAWWMSGVDEDGDVAISAVRQNWRREQTLVTMEPISVFVAETDHVLREAASRKVLAWPAVASEGEAGRGG